MAENESYPTLDEAIDQYMSSIYFRSWRKNQAKSYGEIFTMQNKSNGKKKILISMLEAPMFTVIEKVFSIFSGC